MSLGIVLKGSEGVVLAADSRVTLFSQIVVPGKPPILLPASFDNATKILRVEGVDSVGVVTYGQGAIGAAQPRTAHSYMPEFAVVLGAIDSVGQKKKTEITVKKFAEELSKFFLERWTNAGMPAKVAPGDEMVFLVAGYDKGEPYGKVFEIFVPNNPTPTEKIPLAAFGAIWGGQRSITDRLVQGFDSAAINQIYQALKIPAPQQTTANLEAHLKTQLSLKIPIQFLPLQDCVDLATFLVKATILLQRWTVDVRGVGGAVDVATITRTGGFEFIQTKRVVGETDRLDKTNSIKPGGSNVQ